jgi:hypothetical protein
MFGSYNEFRNPVHKHVSQNYTTYICRYIGMYIVTTQTLVLRPISFNLILVLRCVV